MPPHDPISVAPDAFSASCPSRSVLEVLASKWTTLIFCALSQDAVRYGDLRRRIEGIAPKMLSQTLRSLERDGFVRRTVIPSKPPQVEYALTPSGYEIVRLVEGLRMWSERNVQQVLNARKAFELKQAPVVRPNVRVVRFGQSK